MSGVLSDQFLLAAFFTGIAAGLSLQVAFCVLFFFVAGCVGLWFLATGYNAELNKSALDHLKRNCQMGPTTVF